MSTGELSVLNCGRGDIKITFDKENVAEIERARRIIQDMLKRGYILLVDAGDGVLKRVKRFNANTDAYVVADGPLYAGDHDGPTGGKKKAQKTREKEIPIKKARATGIAPTAGG